MNKESATTTPSSLLSGLRALITGGSQGIGRAIAESFCQAGASIAIAALRDHFLDDAGEVWDGVEERAGMAADEVRGVWGRLRAWLLTWRGRPRS